MSTPKPDKTIDQLFEEFLADQEARLSPKTFDKYEGIIHLYRSYMESYWPDHSGKDYDAVTKAKPAGAKGNYIKRVSVTSTMGPGLKLDIASLSAS